MANRTLVGEDLVIIAPSESFVTEEVDLVVVVGRKELETVRLVPASRKAIETDLPPDAVSQVEVAEFLLHRVHHLLSNPVLQIVLLIIITLLSRTIASNR